MKPKINSMNKGANDCRGDARLSWLSRRNRASKPKLKRGGFLQIDLVFGLAILSIAILPLGFSFAHERQMLKAEYFHSVANEIVDGEMEILVAGEAKHFSDGVQNYPVHAVAADRLPPGHFQLTKTGNHLRLEWLAEGKSGVGPVVRETTIP